MNSTPLSWTDARHVTMTDSCQVQTLLIVTAVAILANRQPAWSDEAGELLLVGESSFPDGRTFSVTDLHQTRFVITVLHHRTATPNHIAQDYEKIRTILALIVYGSHAEPSIVDRFADAWNIQPWQCRHCSSAFAHWPDLCNHEFTVHDMSYDGSS